MTKQIPPEGYESDTAAVKPVEGAHRLRKGDGAGFRTSFFLMPTLRICRLEIKEQLHRLKRQTHRRSIAQSISGLRDGIAQLRGRGIAELCGDETLRHLVVVVFDRLSEMQGAALELKYLGNCSTREVARLLDLQVPAAQDLLAQARTSLQQELQHLFATTQP